MKLAGSKDKQSHLTSKQNTNTRKFLEGKRKKKRRESIDYNIGRKHSRRRLTTEEFLFSAVRIVVLCWARRSSVREGQFVSDANPKRYHASGKGVKVRTLVSKVKCYLSLL
jgi:hypothetical protein